MITHERMCCQVELQNFSVQVNTAEISSLTAFAKAGGAYHNFQKDTVFVRLIGFDGREEYLQELAAVDEVLTARQEKSGIGYLRIHQLDSYLAPEQAERYASLWEQSEFPFHFENAMWERAMNQAFESVNQLFHRVSPRVNDTITRSFTVKFYGWMERYMPLLFRKTKGLGGFPKLILDGSLKKQEYLFLWFLVQLGCDVLYLNPEQDLPDAFGMLLDFSRVHYGEQTGSLSIPLPVTVSPKSVAPVPTGSVRIDASRFRRPDRERELSQPPAARPAANHIPVPSPPSHPVPPAAAHVRPGEPLDYEELAGFASSVVLIGVYNEKKECFKTGSGVFINADGYILTNFHVVNGGAYFGVRLEDQEEIFYTDKLIKYHNLNDLALLKIDNASRPIPIYRGAEKPRRGQKVVAIGSPLGLINTVSDGIISGFRQMNEVSMIQFTAPTSPGSSGGALLDLYGNLIGILTAGFDGQNLNLAVDYQTVLTFVRGFI